MASLAPAPAPALTRHQPRWRGPTVSPSSVSLSSSSSSSSSVESSSGVLHESPSGSPAVDFSPPLIAMVAIAAAAFLIVTYSRLISRHLFPPILHLFRRYRRWRRRRRLFFRPPRLPASSISDIIDSPPYEPSDGFYVYSPYGLDEAAIKAMPLSVYTTTAKINKSRCSSIDAYGAHHDCAVCLLEFEENDYIRTLPLCFHSFHVDCIDIWLRSHATCPLCRAGIFSPRSPFVPMMAARIRPSLDEGILENMFLQPRQEEYSRISDGAVAAGEIEPVQEISASSPRRNQQQLWGEDHRYSENNGAVGGNRDCLLKRSYSFGFERNFPSERLVLEPATGSPWRYHHHHHRRSNAGGFWRRASPFGSLPIKSTSRVFSFRQYYNSNSRGMKYSPAFFFRRRGTSTLFAPMSEYSSNGSSIRNGGGYWGGVSASAGGGSSSSSRRSKSMTSPILGRSSTAMMFSSSRLRCGDPEALLSPERYTGGAGGR